MTAPAASPAVLIIADDLSGAADSAVALADRAATTVVLDATAPWPDSTVVAVDADSRYLPAEAAERLAAAVVDRAGPGTLVYKKIDSTLRGNIGPETAGCLTALARRTGRRHLAVVAPAFPATGRTVRDGRVLIDGQPVEDRHPGRRPLAGQLTAAGLTVTALPLAALRTAGAAVRALTAAIDAGTDAVVVDAETDDDLAATVRACADLPVLLVGSGGLAHRLTGFPAAPAAMTAHNTGPDTAEAAPGGARRPALVCVGSRSDLARAQRDALVTGLPAAAVPVPLTDPDAGDATAAVTAAVTEALLAGRHAVVFPDPDEPVRPDRAADIAAGVARAVRPALHAAGTLLVTGGETARAVLLAAGVHSLTVHGEAEPGVVLMRTHDGLPVITKAGAFGDAGTLLRVVGALPGAPAAPGRPDDAPTASSAH
ncbi:four-carbon acid sugar kinase family protein [Streptomyces sp. RFCAC02]|uniref:four-carbon acid sugar kinase family protein n=1 Tax=Streptomyces sp. RFCAC02 TaxID=2499143 RepID=UPI00101EC250|nr:four-carbon acid sugar kinase family protein [Streptomyces sp. RFCAC02]